MVYFVNGVLWPEVRSSSVWSRDAPIVSAIFQGIGIGTLKFSPIFADTDTFIFLIEKY